MPPRIIDAEYLQYYDAARNSDKVFNIFLIDEGDESYSCVSEYGRRGTSLVRVVVCSHDPPPAARRAFHKKLEAKRNHRETPYWDCPNGANQSPFVSEYAARQRLTEQTSSPKVVAALEREEQAADRRSKKNGILNQEQIDSLEI